MQRDVLSPFLFTLFIADLEDFLRAKGVRGVWLDHLTEVIILAYADDLTILAETKIEMNKILKALYEYCQLNKLEINLEKTKIVIFRKGGHAQNKKITPFMYGNSVVEIVKNYTYLGIPFSQSSVFNLAVENTICKSKIAVTSTISLIHRMDLNSWNSIDKLFRSLLVSIVMYDILVWGIRYLDDIEKIQTDFFKNLLQAPKNTPGYAIRLDAGATQIATKIFEYVLNYIEKMQKMSDERYPKKCFKKMLSIKSHDSDKQKGIKFSWLKLVEKFFETIGEKAVWESPLTKSKKILLIKSYKEKIFQLDLEGAHSSSSLIIFHT